MNCEKITYLIEKGLLTDLNISEKLQVKLHTLYCQCCKNYGPDSDFVNQVLYLLKEEDKTVAFTDDEKNELKDALKELGES